MSKTIEQQLAAIKKTMSKEQFPFYRFTFGQYRGRTLESVMREDRQYLEWLLSEDFITDHVRNKIEKALGVES